MMIDFRKSQAIKGIKGERPFRAALMSALVLLTLLFAGIIVSLVAYTDLDTLISTIVSPEIIYAIKLSLFTATVSTTFAMLTAIPMAYAISHFQFPGKSIVDTILDLPIVISPIALGAALLVFFNTPAGVAIENKLIRFVFEVPGIILAQFMVITALAVRLLKSTFDGIDPRYEQVGRTLGCTKLAAFCTVTLPLARNGLIAAAILTWARAIGEFGATVTLAGATKQKTETLPIAIFLNLATADIEKAVAVIFILIAIAVVALIFLRRISSMRYLR
jgi:molybdate transport system permease protein